MSLPGIGEATSDQLLTYCGSTIAAIQLLTWPAESLSAPDGAFLKRIRFPENKRDEIRAALGVKTGETLLLDDRYKPDVIPF
jgi:hypothetical protein